MNDLAGMTTVARLRELLATIERDLGLNSLSSNELDILYVVRLLVDTTGSDVVDSSQIRDHAIVRSLSQPTINRAIRNLLEKGYLETAPNYKAKRYKLGPQTLGF